MCSWIIFTHYFVKYANFAYTSFKKFKCYHISHDPYSLYSEIIKIQKLHNCFIFSRYNLIPSDFWEAAIGGRKGRTCLTFQEGQLLSNWMNPHGPRDVTEIESYDTLYLHNGGDRHRGNHVAAPNLNCGKLFSWDKFLEIYQYIYIHI